MAQVVVEEMIILHFQNLEVEVEVVYRHMVKLNLVESYHLLQKKAFVQVDNLKVVVQEDQELVA